jgi:exodeoxyribonuclease VII small subunit
LGTDSRSAKASGEEGLAADAPYEAIVERLEGVVARLEGGDLALEESVVAFREGMELLKRAEEKLRASEKRVEELLESGKTAPLEGERQAAAPPKAPGRRASLPSEDDVPF